MSFPPALSSAHPADDARSSAGGQAGAASRTASAATSPPRLHPRWIILASRSPRRSLLLAEHGYRNVIVVPSGIDDGELLPPPGLTPEHWAAALAWLKARATLDRLMRGQDRLQLPGSDGASAGETLPRAAADCGGVAGGAESGAGGHGKVEPAAAALAAAGRGDVGAAGRSLLILGADTVVEVEGEMVGQPVDLADARRIIHRLNARDHRVITGVALIECEVAPAESAAAGEAADHDDDGGGTATADGRVAPGAWSAMTVATAGEAAIGGITADIIPAVGSAPAVLRPLRRHLFVDTAAVTVGEIPDAAIETYLATHTWRGKTGAYNLSERIEAGWPITYTGDPTTVMGLPMGELGRVVAGSIAETSISRQLDKLSCGNLAVGPLPLFK